MESFMTSSPSLHTEIQLEENSGGSYEEMFAKAMEAWHRKDYATSFPAFKMLADSGYSKAYGYLGIAYEFGEGVARNWQMAESLYEMSIKTHDHVGVYRMALRYRRQSQDALALDLARRDASYAFHVGHAYSLEEGCPHDDEIAKICFELGASNGDKDCQWKLGLIYKKNGDDERAVRKFWEAAEQGQGMAMFELAQCYEMGIGTPCDRSLAILWYERCKKSQYAASSDAKRRLQEIERDVPESDEPDTLNPKEDKNESQGVRGFFRSLFK